MQLTINSELQDLLQPLTNEEYAILEGQLLKDGCKTPIEVTGSIIVDGHNRYEICQKHNLTFTTSSLTFNSIEEVKDYIDRNQAGRRNMTETYEQFVFGRIYNRTKNPVGKPKGKKFGQNVQISVAQQIADEYGINEKTVRRAGKFADEVEQDPELKKAVRLGRKAAKEYKNEKKKAKTQAYRNREATKKDVSKIELKADDIQLFNCDILDAPIKDNSLDAIITDPPYPREFLPCWNKLAEFAVKKLKDGGILIAASGHSYLPEVYKAMTIEGLNYYWTGCIYQPGMSANLNVKRLRTNWKPLLIFVKGDYGDRTFQGSDTYVSEYKDTSKGQEWHKWGQNYEVFNKIVHDYTYKNEVICDPYLGGATTAMACISNKRKFIGVELDEARFKAAQKRIAEAL